MSDDVRIAVGLRRHRKTKRLKRLLGGEGCWALICLFLWAAEERWTGDLSGLSDFDLEEEADWSGDAGALVDALLQVGFLAGEKGERRIHDWQEHNPYAASKGQRIEKAKRAAAARWGEASPSDATSMQQACGEHATAGIEQCPPTPTTPSPSLRSGEARKRATPPPECPDDVPRETWRDWLTLRRAKKAPVTETVLRQARAEAAKAGLSLADFLAAWCARGSQGLQAEWLTPAERSRAGPAPPPTPKSRTLTAIETLQAMKSDGRVAERRNPEWPEPLALPQP